MCCICPWQRRQRLTHMATGSACTKYFCSFYSGDKRQIQVVKTSGISNDSLQFWILPQGNNTWRSHVKQLLVEVPVSQEPQRAAVNAAHTSESRRLGQQFSDLVSNLTFVSQKETQVKDPKLDPVIEVCHDPNGHPGHPEGLKQNTIFEDPSQSRLFRSCLRVKLGTILWSLLWTTLLRCG